jgi:hypothetical protein
MLIREGAQVHFHHTNYFHHPLHSEKQRTLSHCARRVLQKVKKQSNQVMGVFGARRIQTQRAEHGGGLSGIHFQLQTAAAAGSIFIRRINSISLKLFKEDVAERSALLFV